MMETQETDVRTFLPQDQDSALQAATLIDDRTYSLATERFWTLYDPQPATLFDAQTYGDPSDLARFAGRGPLGILAQPQSLISALTDEQLVQQATRLLSELHVVLEALIQAWAEVAQSKPLRAFLADDGSLLMEWAYPDFRMGFSLEPEPRKSSWFLVSMSLSSLGGIQASGYLPGGDAVKLLCWLVTFLALST